MKLTETNIISTKSEFETACDRFREKIEIRVTVIYDKNCIYGTNVLDCSVNNTDTTRYMRALTDSVFILYDATNPSERLSKIIHMQTAAAKIFFAGSVDYELTNMYDTLKNEIKAYLMENGFYAESFRILYSKNFEVEEFVKHIHKIINA